VQGNDTRPAADQTYGGLSTLRRSGHDNAVYTYCGPIEPSQMVNPVRSLSDEFAPDWPLFAKFLRVISSNAIVLSLLFVLAYVLYTPTPSHPPCITQTTRVVYRVLLVVLI